MLEQQPDWEHGYVWYDLRCMLSQVGKNQEAIECIERALTSAYEAKSRSFSIAQVTFAYPKPSKLLKAHLS